jgi:hypothetical protein
MRTITMVLAELQAAMETSKLDLDTKSPAVRAGFGMMKTEAEVSIPRLRNEYRDLLLSNVVLIFTTGEGCRKFAEIAAREGSTMTFDATEVFDRIADRILPTVGIHREFTTQQFASMNDAIEDFSKGSSTPLTVTTNHMGPLVVVQDEPAISRHVQLLCSSARGNALVKHFFGEKIVDQGLAAKTSGKTLAIVVLNASDGVREDLAALATSVRVHTVDLNDAEEINKAFVVGVFKEASKAVKKTN